MNLVLNPTKHVQDLYTENDKMLMEEIKEYCIQRSGETYCIYGLKHSTQEVSILPKQICRCKANPIKIPMSFLIDKVLKFIQEFKGTRIANTFSKKNKMGGICLISKLRNSCRNQAWEFGGVIGTMISRTKQKTQKQTQTSTAR